MSELELIIDLHKKNKRQGPGSTEETLKALSHMGIENRSNWRVADLGCGTGGPTLALAGALNGEVSAVDVFPEFLDELIQNASSSGLGHKIKIVKASMDSLSFERESLDIIWSEGAIYNIGFEQGVKQWKQYLKIGGYLAVSEITWITPTRPTDINDFWKAEYPEIDTASNKINVLERNGYSPVGYFFLKTDSWLKEYYEPLEAGFDEFLERHHHSDLANKVIEDNRAEINLYREFKDYYSYGFYIAKRLE